jgi:ankyrin repeat protein
MAFTHDLELLEFVDAAVVDHDKARRLLGCSPDLLNRRNNLEETPLHFLSVENYAAGVAFLCQCGAEADTCDFTGATPLMHAATLGHDDVVKLLLAHGANPNAVDQNGDSVLTHARGSESRTTIELLIQAGAK